MLLKIMARKPLLWLNNMIKAVIFDMYETLVSLWVDTNHYMGKQIAADAGIAESTFREIWDPSEEPRTLGKLSYEDVIEKILKVNGKYSEELFAKLVRKRREINSECFGKLHAEILPMLEELHRRGIKLGLVTNCYYEEADAIKESSLYPYFDGVCMSCEMGMKKPEKKIFEMCLSKLDVLPEEAIYCGDGGSRELEVAGSIGMKPVQAVWYLRDGLGQPVGRLPEYIGASSPMELIDLLG